MKCELTISRIHGAEDGKLVRIDAVRDGKLLSRIEVDITHFALAVMGLGCVPADHSITRGHGPRP